MTQMILFDVDGTLVESTMKITNDMVHVLTSIANKNISLNIVGGGTFDKIISQLNGHHFLFDYICCESGAIVYKAYDETIDEKIYRNYKCIKTKNIMNEITKLKLNNIYEQICDIFMEDVIKNIDEPQGVNIDERSGFIYLSYPGMSADNDYRKKFIEYNKKHDIIGNMIYKLVNLTDKFEFVRGGSCGINVSLPGWNKLQVLDYISTDNLYFFGDKCDYDGNDYPLYSHKNIRSFAVNSWEQTLKYLNNIFN